jgi:hypothetical protein
MQHLFTTQECRKSSNGVECSWRDPESREKEDDWQALFYRVSHIPNGQKTISDVIIRIIGLISHEFNNYKLLLLDKTKV